MPRAFLPKSRRKQLRTMLRSLLFRLRRPSRARSFSGRTIFIDPDDKRSKRVYVFADPIHRPDLATWIRLADLVEWTDVVDVGANYGEFIVALNDVDRLGVLAFEPNPVVAELLARTCAANRIELTLETRAVGSGTEDVELFLGKESSGRSSLIPGDAVSSTSLVVPQVRLADYLIWRDGASRSARRYLFKIDIEGNEAAALEGLRSVWDELGDAAILLEASHLAPQDWSYLRGRHHVVALSGAGAWISLDDVPDRAALQEARMRHGFNDVVLFRRGSPSDAWQRMKELAQESAERRPPEPSSTRPGD